MQKQKFFEPRTTSLPAATIWQQRSIPVATTMDSDPLHSRLYMHPQIGDRATSEITKGEFEVGFSPLCFKPQCHLLETTGTCLYISPLSRLKPRHSNWEDIWRVEFGARLASTWSSTSFPVHKLTYGFNNYLIERRNWRSRCTGTIVFEVRWMTTEGELTINNFLRVRTSVPVLKYLSRRQWENKNLGEWVCQSEDFLHPSWTPEPPNMLRVPISDFGDCRRWYLDWQSLTYILTSQARRWSGELKDRSESEIKASSSPFSSKPRFLKTRPYKNTDLPARTNAAKKSNRTAWQHSSCQLVPSYPSVKHPKLRKRF